MYPDLFGVTGLSMGLMMAIGAIAAFILVFFYLNKNGLEKKSYLDFTIVIISTLFFGILFAMLFENLYEAIKHSVNGESQAWTWSKTFYGGLFGGVVAFLLTYHFYYLRNNLIIKLYKHFILNIPYSSILTFVVSINFLPSSRNFIIFITFFFLPFSSIISSCFSTLITSSGNGSLS